MTDTSCESEDKIKTEVGGDGHRYLRIYSAYTANGVVHIYVAELDGGEVVSRQTTTHKLADDGETVAFDGRHWKEYAKERFKRLNDARWHHEYQELKEELCLT